MGNSGMGVSIEYAIVAVSLSALSFVLAIIYAVGVIRAYRQWHDERAAISLAKGLGLLVVAAGLLLSATGLLFESPSFSVAGLSVARGAFIVLMATLVLAHVRPGRDE